MADDRARRVDLRSRWDVLLADLSRLGPAARDVGANIGDDLLDRYGEAGRHYHGLRHLVAVLDTIEELLTPSAPSPTVRLAAWFHDAVYDPTAADNEARSAALAHLQLRSMGLGSALIDDVAALVLATVAHQPVAVVGADVFLDADLAVLGAAPAGYDRYARAIRAEYAHVDDSAYRAGRAAVLARFLERPELYYSPAGRARFERRARSNLRRELEALRRPTER